MKKSYQLSYFSSILSKISTAHLFFTASLKPGDNMPSPKISKHSNTQTMSAKFLLPCFLSMAALVISCSTYAQTTVTTNLSKIPVNGTAAGISYKSVEVSSLSKEATTAILNFKKQRENKTEAQVKEDQSKLMKTFCPNHPAYQPAAQGASKASMDAAENWKKKYPAEYAAYLQIFDFKQ